MYICIYMYPNGASLHCKIFFFNGSTAPWGPRPPLFLRLHHQIFLDTPHSVGLLWMRDQLVAETSTWQHTTLTRDRYLCPGGIRTDNPSKRAAADPRLRPHGHWDWLSNPYRICCSDKVAASASNIFCVDSYLTCHLLIFQAKYLWFSSTKCVYVIHMH
jgi:hypothetical protein